MDQVIFYTLGFSSLFQIWQNLFDALTRIFDLFFLIVVEQILLSWSFHLLNRFHLSTVGSELRHAFDSCQVPVLYLHLFFLKRFGDPISQHHKLFVFFWGQFFTVLGPCFYHLIVKLGYLLVKLRNYEVSLALLEFVFYGGDVVETASGDQVH